MNGSIARLLVVSTFAVGLLAVAPAATAQPSRLLARTNPRAAAPVTIGSAIAFVRGGDGRPVAVQPTALPR